MRNSKLILLVENNGAETMLIKHAPKYLQVSEQLLHTVNGKEASEYLRTGLDFE